MPNLTRDVFHPFARSTTNYCDNLNTLRIYVDGKQVSSKLVRDVFMSPHARAPYVTLFETDDNDKIIPNGGRPNVVEIEGAITIEGEPTYCGCWKGRQVDGWWDKW